MGRELPLTLCAGSANGARVSPVRTSATPQGEPRLLERVRQVLRARGYAWRTEESYVHWIIRYVLFHNKRHPFELRACHIEAFLTHLVVRSQVSASTQNQAFHALLFLYQQVLEVELPLIRAVQSRKPRRLPVVMARAEVRQVLDQINGCDGLYSLMTRLHYGSGLRLMKCCRLRVGSQLPIAN